jgi:hypothetical protein
MYDLGWAPSCPALPLRPLSRAPIDLDFSTFGSTEIPWGTVLVRSLYQESSYLDRTDA